MGSGSHPSAAGPGLTLQRSGSHHPSPTCLLQIVRSSAFAPEDLSAVSLGTHFCSSATRLGHKQKKPLQCGPPFRLRRLGLVPHPLFHAERPGRASSPRGSGPIETDFGAEELGTSGQRRQPASGVLGWTTRLRGAGEPASKLFPARERGPDRLRSGTRLLSVLRPPRCPRLNPPPTSFMRLFPFLPPLSCAGWTTAARGVGGGVQKERISDVEEKRGEIGREARREKRDHAGSRAARGKRVQRGAGGGGGKAAGGRARGRRDTRRAGSSRGGGEHGGRRKEEEAFRCFSERDVKTENKNRPVNGLLA